MPAGDSEQERGKIQQTNQSQEEQPEQRANPGRKYFADCLEAGMKRNKHDMASARIKQEGEDCYWGRGTIT